MPRFLACLPYRRPIDPHRALTTFQDRQQGTGHYKVSRIQAQGPGKVRCSIRLLYRREQEKEIVRRGGNPKDPDISRVLDRMFSTVFQGTLTTNGLFEIVYSNPRGWSRKALEIWKGEVAQNQLYELAKEVAIALQRAKLIPLQVEYDRTLACSGSTPERSLIEQLAETTYDAHVDSLNQAIQRYEQAQLDLAKRKTRLLHALAFWRLYKFHWGACSSISMRSRSGINSHYWIVWHALESHQKEIELRLTGRVKHARADLFDVEHRCEKMSTYQTRASNEWVAALGSLLASLGIGASLLTIWPKSFWLFGPIGVGLAFFFLLLALQSVTKIKESAEDLSQLYRCDLRDS